MGEHFEKRNDWQQSGEKTAGQSDESTEDSCCPELRHRLHELEESEIGYRSIVEHCSDLVWNTDPKHTFTYVNPRSLDLLGYDPEEVLGETPFDFMPPEEAHRAAQALLPLIAGRKPIETFENIVLHKDGHEVVLEASARPIFDAQNNFLGYTWINRDTTKRKRAENALRRSEGLFKVLFENSIDMIWILSGHFFTRANPSAARTLGFDSPNEIVGLTPWDISPEYQPDGCSSREKAISYMNAAIGDHPQSFEWLHERKDGTSIYCQITMTAIVVDGEVLVQAIGRDVTERNMSKLAMKESEEKFRALAENAQAQIFIAQGNKYVYVNPYFAELMGYTNAELLSKDIIEFVHPDFRDLILERLPKRLAGEPVPTHYEFAMLSKDGRKIWLDYSGARIEYKGKPAIVGVGFDITERKMAELAIEESEEKFRALAENAQAQILITQGTKYIYANPYSAELMGYTNAELLSKDIIEFVHPDFRDLILERLAKRLTGEAVPTHYEFAVLSKDGRKIWLDYSGARIEYKGKPAIVGVGFDITERKMAEEEKRAFYRETILSATDDKLKVTDETEIRPYIEGSQERIVLREAAEVCTARSVISEFCKQQGLPGEQLDMFLVGVGEAIDNAVKHDGVAHIYAGTDGKDIWVTVSDNGPGIGSLVFPRAVLRRGFSTKPSMGLGYSIMLQVSDQILLNTGKSGTTVVLVKKLVEEAISLLDNLPDTWEGIPDLTH